jgi:hypothetical protein
MMVGDAYTVKHDRRGKFVFVCDKIHLPFVTGKMHETGEKVTFRLDLCSFAPTTQPEKQP